MHVVCKTSTMLLLTDNDVIGAVRVLRRILESPEWVDMTATLELQFIALQDVELPADAPDVAVWQRSQEVGALLITGNRSSGEGSLIGVGKGSRPPRPPNRAGGSPAHGSPVGSFLIGIGAPAHRLHAR